jgi:periplasmic copper chaperone A
VSRSRPTRPRGVAVLVGAMIGAAALAGCGAGQVTQTSSQVAAVSGAGARAGHIHVGDARIEFAGGVEGASIYPRGAGAPLQMRIVNEGAEADRLLSASSPVASSVQVSGVTEVPGGQVLVVEGEPVAPAAATSRGARATPSPAPAPAAAGAREAQIVLTGLREDIRAGLNYEVVLVFERAGEIRLDVPVGSTEEPREDEPAAE